MTRFLSRCSRSVPLIAVTLLLTIHGVDAAPPEPGPPPQPKIVNVIANYTTMQLTISGTDFGLNPVVAFAGMALDVVSASSSQIVVPLPASAMVTPGTYLVTVSNGPGAAKYDTFAVAIGAAGPQGDKGDKGDKGDQGETGDTGEQGIQGEKGAKGDKGDPGPQGLPGNLALAGQRCPTDQSVIGFDTAGRIVCSGSVEPPPPTCANTTFTFTAVSTSGSTFDGAEWRGTTFTQGTTECRVSVKAPSGNVSLVGTLGDRWQVVGRTGFSSCFGVGGPNGDGVQTPDCSDLTLSIGSVTAGRPSCSNSLCTFCNGSARDNYTVQCLQ